MAFGAPVAPPASARAWLCGHPAQRASFLAGALEQREHLRGACAATVRAVRRVRPCASLETPNGEDEPRSTTTTAADGDESTSAPLTMADRGEERASPPPTAFEPERMGRRQMFAAAAAACTVGIGAWQARSAVTPPSEAEWPIAVRLHKAAGVAQEHAEAKQAAAAAEAAGEPPPPPPPPPKRKRQKMPHSSAALTPIGPEPSIADVILGPASAPSLVANMFASGAARLVAISATHPIDTVKTKVQTSRGEARGALEITQLILQRDGIGGLYAGLDGTMVGQVPYSAVAFAVYEFLKEQLTPHLPPALWAYIVCYLVCGSIGDIVGSLIVVPSEVVKTRLQTGTYGTIREAVDSIIADSGWTGLYAGYTSQLIRDVPFRAIQATVFECLRLLPSSLSDSTLAAGMLAGAVAAALTTPLDVVKTRLMAQDPHAAPPTPAPDGAPRSPAPYAGPVEALVRIAGEEGPGALLRGIGPRVLVIAPMSSIFFAVYEALRNAF